MTKLVCGVGFNDRKYPVSLERKHIKEYNLWRSLLNRCYSPICQKKRPTYIGCSASENFKSYSYFYEWCHRQIGFGQEDFQLDKDFLIKGNKVYSEDTCLFLPRELNSLLISSKACRGSLPVGVSAHQGKFKAECHRGLPSNYLGHFHTPELAHNAYKQAKEAYIKSQAEKWKALIDPRAFAALMAYTVSITD